MTDSVGLAATGTVERRSAGPEPERRRVSGRIRVPDTIGLLVFLLAEIVFFSIRSPYFLNWGNWVNIISAIAITGVLAAAGTLLIVAGQFDLSVGSGIAFVGLVLVEAAPRVGIALAVLLACLAGVGIGVLNGFVVTVLGVNPLITTLGTLALFRGLTLVIGHGHNILVDGFSWAIKRPVFDVPMSALVFVLVIAAFFVLMSFTVYGRKMFAIGANPIAARLVGIKVNRAIFVGFVLSGACMALAGLISTSQLGSTSGSTGTGLELAAITAVVLGGTSLAGGTGSVLGTVIGLLIVGVLSNGLTLLNIDSSWQQVASGSLLILAVAFDRLRQRLAREA